MESRRGRGREEVTAEGGGSRRVKLGGGREEWEGREGRGDFWPAAYKSCYERRIELFPGVSLSRISMEIKP